MPRRKKTLSLDDRKAVDIILDHPPGDSVLKRLTTGVPSNRIAAVTRLLHLLNEMPEIDPPQNLVAKTMDHIDRHISHHGPHRPPAALPPSAHLQ